MRQVSLICKTGRRLKIQKAFNSVRKRNGKAIIKAYNLRLMPTENKGEDSSQGGPQEVEVRVPVREVLDQCSAKLRGPCTSEQGVLRYFC